MTKNGSARLTMAFRVTGCTSSLSCTLWMESVSRYSPAKDGRKTKRTWREPYGRTQPRRSSERIITSKEAWRPVLSIL